VLDARIELDLLGLTKEVDKNGGTSYSIILFY